MATLDLKYLRLEPQYDHIKLNNNFENESNQILYCTNSTDIYNDDRTNDFILSFIEEHNFKFLIRVKQTDSIERWKI